MLSYYAKENGRTFSFQYRRDRDDWIEESPDARLKLTESEKRSRRLRLKRGKYDHQKQRMPKR